MELPDCLPWDWPEIDLNDPELYTDPDDLYEAARDREDED